jgi:hypothetical protein
MICQDGKPNLSNPSTNVRSVLRLKKMPASQRAFLVLLAGQKS